MNVIRASLIAGVALAVPFGSAFGEGQPEGRKNNVVSSVAQGDIPFCPSMPVLVQQCPPGQNTVVLHEAVVDPIDSKVLCIDRSFMCVAQSVFVPPAVVAQPTY